MPDMSKPEYLTTDWLDDLKRSAEALRQDAAMNTALANQLDEVRRDFDKRIREHEKWRPQETDSDAV